MAYFNQPEEDEKESSQGMNSEDQSQSSSAPVQLSNQSAAVNTTTGAGTNNVQKSTAPKAATSGSGPGFQNYAKANQGKAQDNLNSSVAQNVANAGQAATNSINQATTSFNQRADQGALGGQQSRSTAVQDAQSTVDAARGLQAGNSVAQASQDRFKDVINASYQGPESLRQAGLYNPAAEKVSTAQNALNNTKTATGREELLKQMYAQRGDYTAGLNKLDSALLNASQQGVKNLQDTAAAQGNVQQKLDQAQIGSANQAQNLTNEVRDIRQQARDNFTTGKAAEEAATEARLASVVENWEKLPEYFRDIIRQQSKGTTNFNTLESELLGIGSGEGLYNLGANAIKSGVADKAKLISKDEQARQAALASLAGLDSSNLLSKNLLYDNADLAGTQTALDALDLAGTRTALNEAEKNFQDFAQGTDLSATAYKKNKTSGKKYYNTQSANIGDVLENAGYNFGQTGVENNIENTDLLKALASVSKGEAVNEASDLTTPYQNQSTGSQLNSLFNDVGSGGVSAALRSLGIDLPFANDNNFVLDSATGGTTKLLRDIGLDIPGLTNIGSLFGGGSNSKLSKQQAKQYATNALNKKIESSLDSQGFSNRANVVDNEATTSRLSALQALLANLDKTNV